jgi:hypothetical protein
MSFHLSQQAEMFGRIQEHASHNFCQNTFGCTRNACIIKKMTSLISGKVKR